MAFSSKNLEISVDSREYSHPIQTATYPHVLILSIFKEKAWSATKECQTASTYAPTPLWQKDGNEDSCQILDAINGLTFALNSEQHVF